MSFCPCVYKYFYIYTYQNRTLLASPCLYTTNCPGLLRGSRRLPGLGLPAVLLVDLLVDPASISRSPDRKNPISHILI